METDTKTCLNCGTRCEGRYCPECGQSLATRRFDMRSLGLHVLSSLTRVSADFVRTVWGLLRHPWVVIRDYVYGKRVGLVSPVSMLLLLALYWGVVMAVLPHFSQADKLESMHLGAILKWLYGSLTFQYLFLAVPVALGTWLVYRGDMRGRFNFAELMIATLYLASTFLIVNFILVPVELLNEWVGNVLLIVATGFYGVMSLLRAFPQPTRGRTALRLAAWTAVSGVLLFIFLLIFALPIYRHLL